jgi:hypothetical protein
VSREKATLQRIKWHSRRGDLHSVLLSLYNEQEIEMADYGEAMNKLREALLLLSQTTMKQDSADRWLDLLVTFKIEDETVILADWLIEPTGIIADWEPFGPRVKH